MRNKKEDIEETTLHKDGSSAVLSLWKRKGKKIKKGVLQHAVLVFGHPTKY